VRSLRGKSVDPIFPNLFRYKFEWPWTSNWRRHAAPKRATPAWWRR
jgi:hypothetical protein